MENHTPTLDGQKAVILAGFLGSLLSLGFVNDMGLKRRILAISAGVISAHYLTPMIAFLLNEDKYQETIGFLVGLFGMSIVAAIFRAIHKSDLWGLLSKRVGGTNSEGSP